MLRNYLKTALRNLIRTRLYSFINVLGLSIGMAACLLILQHVRYENSYDGYHRHNRRIYRLRYERTSEDGSSVRFASCCPPAADFIRGVYPEVEKIARIFRQRGVVSPKGRDIHFLEERMYFAESDFFNIFNIIIEKGDPAISLIQANRAFLSQTTAGKYFGSAEPVGQTLLVDGKVEYTESGVFEDIPQNSHLKSDIFLSYPNLVSLRGPEVIESWGHTGFFTYLRLKVDADPEAFEYKLKDLVEARCGGMMKTYKMLIELKMQPLRDIHLTSHFMQEFEVNGSRGSVNFLILVAVFIIVMAWINYVNLSTARSLTRAKEVGLRKVVGASRPQLIVQFFSETLVINLFSAALAALLLLAALPVFSRITGMPLTASFWTAPFVWRTAFLMFTAGIVLSGLYPVAALSPYQPITALRARPENSSGGLNLRKVLVVFQFIIALALMTGAFTVVRQIGFMKRQELGFDMERVLVVNAPRVKPETFEAKLQVFKDEILRSPHIEKMCVVTEVPGRQIYWDAGGIHKAGEGIGRSKNYQIVGIDYDFVDVFDLQIIRGRNFSKTHPSDDTALILNQTAVGWMGFSSDEEAVGGQVDYWGDIFTVVGVLKDYHQRSPKSEFEPHLFRLMPTAHRELGRFALKIGTGDPGEILGFVEGVYRDLFPGNPFEYVYLDQYFNQQYRADEGFGLVIGIFSILAAFVTALGIFGISSFTTLQRTREIGIRKVLGASTPGIIRLLSLEILALLGFAVIIAWPLTYWGIRRWLDRFVLRMAPDAWLFLAPLILVALITGLSLVSNTLRAAHTDPIDTIRHE